MSEQLIPGPPTETGTYFAVIKCYVSDEPQMCVLHYQAHKELYRAVGHAFNIEVKAEDIVGYVREHSASLREAIEDILLKTGKHNQDECSEIADAIIRDVPEATTIADYEEVLADYRKLVRHLDLLINGDAAAEQASLCDLVKQIEDFGLPAINNPKYKGGALWPLYIKDKATGERHEVNKVVYHPENEPEPHIWCDTWYGHHIIGKDCEWAMVRSKEGNKEREIAFAEWLRTFDVLDKQHGQWVLESQISSEQLWNEWDNQKQKQ